MNNKVRPILVVLLIAITAIGILISAHFVLQVSAQTDTVTDLTERLIQAGVQTEIIRVLSRNPFQIEIVVQRYSNGEKWSFDEFWEDHIIEREAELTYKYNHRLDSYTIIYVNENGEVIEGGQKFLYPNDPSQIPYPFNSSISDDQIAEKLVMDRIELFGVDLESIEVTTGIGSFSDVQLLKINLSTNDRNVADRAASRLVHSIRQLVEEMNKESGVRIAVVYVELVDDTGTPLLVYLWDLELRKERGGTAEGISDWFPSPVEPEEHKDPTPTAFPTMTFSPYPESSAPGMPATQPAYP
jgi:hypothetical protein